MASPLSPVGLIVIDPTTDLVVSGWGIVLDSVITPGAEWYVRGDPDIVPELVAGLQSGAYVASFNAACDIDGNFLDPYYDYLSPSVPPGIVRLATVSPFTFFPFAGLGTVAFSVSRVVPFTP